MKKRIFIVPVKNFPETSLRGLVDVFIKECIAGYFISKRVTTSNALVVTIQTMFESTSQEYLVENFAEKIALHCKFMMINIPCERGSNNMAMLFKEVARMYFDTKAKVPNIIVPVDYDFLVQDKWEQLLQTVHDMNLPEIGWIAEAAIDDIFQKQLATFSFATNPKYDVSAKEYLAVGTISIPKWLNTQKYKEIDREWYEPLIFQLLHTPQTSENHEARKRIWSQLRTRKGYVYGSVFPE